MLKSALNFAAGFFGIPYEEQYHQLITIEAPGFNNTLSPYSALTLCPSRARRVRCARKQADGSANATQ